MRIGIIFGCFIPFHTGHIWMINKAFNENDLLIIGVCGYDDDRGKDFISFRERFKLMYNLYGHDSRTMVVPIDDKKLDLDGTFTLENWRLWCNELFQNAHIDPELNDEFTWYSGEKSYLSKISTLYPKHKFELLDRSIKAVSGTMIRENPEKYKRFIHPAFREYLYEKGILKEEKYMKLHQIITSLLEIDAYKLSMDQAIYHQFSDYKTTWTFKCRNKDVHFTVDMVDEIKEQIKAYCKLQFTEDELAYIDGIKWIKGSYVDFLRLWRPRYEDFEITDNAECGLSIETKGTWLNTSMYEIPVLAIVNEVYFRMAYDYDELLESFKERLEWKYQQLHDGKWYAGTFSEFGLRRRLSAEAQELVVEKFSHLNDTAHCASTFVGTSNVYLAKKYGVTPVGTMAHEWIMCVGQGNHKHNPAYSNWYALNAWVKEYGILNGTALTDAITTNCFLKDFQLTFATLFSGVRHDSGDPIEWGEKMIAHYKALGIDPSGKTLLFSDSLNFEKADQIFRHFNGRAKVAFGIGTYLSNDTCVEPLNIVMKTTKCNGMDVAKVSDVEGKGMCKNPEYVDYLQRCIKWRMNHEK